MKHRKQVLFSILILSTVLFSLNSALDNGLVRTPPMGWMSWTLFLCQTDCERYPFSCISEQLYMDMADRMAEDGYLKAGYEYVHIDDCWMQWERDKATGRLLSDTQRFPSGIKALSAYMHSKGLKLGIYEDFGTKTCQGYPGSLGYLETDAQTFSDWDVDYLKLDGCYSTPDQMKDGYPNMSIALNQTGRPILSWDSILGIIKWYNENQDKLREGQKIGAWNDPDMIIVGNTEISVDQAKAQMSIWAIWSAPLIMSNDLRTITAEHKEILLNERVIAIDQDPLGIMGKMVFKDDSVFVYVKEVTPVDTAKQLYSYAIAVLNHGNASITFSTDLASLGLPNRDGYELQDLWTGEKLGLFSLTEVLKRNLAPTSVVFLKATLPFSDIGTALEGEQKKKLKKVDDKTDL